MSGIETFESLVDFIIMEQMSNSLPVEVRAFVESRSPKSAKDVASLADLHFDCNREQRQSNSKENASKHPNGKFKTRFQSQADQESEQTSKEGEKSNASALGRTPHSTESPAPNSETHKKNVICFVCNKRGHVASWHRQTPLKSNFASVLNSQTDVLRYQNHNVIIPCNVFGKQV